MSIRHAALWTGAALVLGLGVYLFVEVRAQPVPLASAGPETAPTRTVAEPPPAAAPPAPRPTPPPARVLAAVPPQPAPTAGPAAGSSAAPARPGPVLAADPAAAPADLDAAMTEANRAYDRGDLDEAKTLAARLLARQPTNVRMLRILVSASCIDGDTAAAQASFAKLPPPDQAQMRVRCARYGVAFPGP
ncbi:MAG TPA: hypothetical protein VHT91_31050 [Kofleriaceae bacterium]|nr:hypothetical protein [Kofleriaceae bacterium]